RNILALRCGLVNALNRIFEDVAIFLLRGPQRFFGTFRLADVHQKPDDALDLLLIIKQWSCREMEGQTASIFLKAVHFDTGQGLARQGAAVQSYRLVSSPG